jgi:hypothetical protein
MKKKKMKIEASPLLGLLLAAVGRDREGRDRETEGHLAAGLGRLPSHPEDRGSFPIHFFFLVCVFLIPCCTKWH